ncbi:MAG: PHP domain-containing protein [Candidatus Omnitrophica bacterium]|nr:PHP domain-containing protein [Candidatus Omnitrophota bacterium]
MKDDLTADLHIHTCYSDGSLTPEQVVDLACEAGLGAVSVTDHDCVEGVRPAMSAAKAKGIEVIPGVEISCEISGQEIHLLGYFIDLDDDVLNAKLAVMKENRLERMRGMIKLLNGIGIKVSEKDIAELSPVGIIGRMHIAYFLANNRYVRTVQDAFDKYLSSGKPCHVKYKRFTHDEAIEMVVSSGGVPVIAHPLSPNIEKFIPDLVKSGVRGIEAYHPKHNPKDTLKFIEIAESNGLITTGGSDCHGGPVNTTIGKVRATAGMVEAIRSLSGS